MVICVGVIWIGTALVKVSSLKPPGISNNASGESAASQEAINRAQAENDQGVQRVVVDTRSGSERPLIGTDAVDYQAKPYESVEFRGGDRDGEVIDQGAKARPYKQRLVKPNSLPEADVARLTWNVNELDRLLEGDPAVKRVRELKAQIPAMLSNVREEQQVVRRQINSLREDPHITEDSPELKTKIDRMQELKELRQRYTELYHSTPAKLGDVQKPYIGNVYPDPRLNPQLTEEGRVRVAQKVQARIDQAHDNIRALLRTETNPARRAVLQRQLNQDVVVKTGKGMRPDISQYPDGTLQISTPEISLKTVRQLNKTLGDGRYIQDLVSLVPDAERENVQYLKQTDPFAYRQAVQQAARDWVKQLRDNASTQLEAAKGRVQRDVGAARARKTQKISIPETGIILDQAEKTVKQK
jgi:hypothetical protein